MSRARLPFKESDVTRAIKAVCKAGLDVARVEIIIPDGKIVVIPKTDGDGDDTDREMEESEYMTWKKHARKT